MAHDHDKILKGFVLSSDSLFEIRRLMERRPRSRFSEGLSREAKLAMQQTREDSLLSFDGYGDTSGTNGNDKFTTSDKQNNRKRVQSPRKQLSKGNLRPPKKQISFSETKTVSGNGVNDNSFGKSTVLPVEEVRKSPEAEVNTDKVDDGVDKETKLQSVEKCIDWMEENDVGNQREDPDSVSSSPVQNYRLPKK